MFNKFRFFSHLKDRGITLYCIIQILLWFFIQREINRLINYTSTRTLMCVRYIVEKYFWICICSLRNYFNWSLAVIIKHISYQDLCVIICSMILIYLYDTYIPYIYTRGRDKISDKTQYMQYMQYTQSTQYTQYGSRNCELRVLLQAQRWKDKRVWMVLRLRPQHPASNIHSIQHQQLTRK